MSAPRGGGGGGGGGGHHAQQQQGGKKRRHPQADVPQQQQQRGGGGGGGGYRSSAAASGPASAMSLEGVASAPRTLHVLEFAEARAREIASLTHLLSGGGAAGAADGPANPSQISGGGRRVFQSLPRHMRRRAMSHNIKRLPLRLQGAAQREMDKIAHSAPAKGAAAAGSGEAGSGTKGPSRRKRRRPTNVLAMHAHRMGKHQWLETHIWHAKRMRMANQWGYKMALQPTDRSLRACYNAGVQLATAYDASAMQVLSLSAVDVGSIAALLAHMLPVSDLTTLLSDDVVSGQRETTIRMYQPGAAPYGFITHAKGQWQPQEAAAASTESAATSTRQLWLWLHPSIYALVQSLLQSQLHSAPASASVRVQPLLGELCRIELRGHRCQAVLRVAIREVEKKATAAAAAASASVVNQDADMKDGTTAQAAPSAQVSIGALLSQYSSAALFPAHRIYSLQAQHPELMRPTPSQPFQLMDASREKQTGAIRTKNSTFSKANDASMRMQLSQQHHRMLFGTDAAADASTTSVPLGCGPSPLFDADFRRAHTRETRWGLKKQRYARIARRETERKRKMHERRRTDDSAAAIATAAMSDDDVGAASDSAIMHRRAAGTGKPQPPAPASATKKRSKDDLDVGTSRTPLPAAEGARAPVAPLTNQPYLMLIQQPGVASQSTAATPGLQVNSATQSLGSGWDIVCGAGWGILLWKALIFAGARSIGSEDRARFQHELRRFDTHSPQDAPDSHAGQAAQLFRQRCARWHSDRIPTNKKPAYHRNHVAHPFAQPWFELMEIAQQEEGEKPYEACVAKPASHMPHAEQAEHTDAEGESESEVDETRSSKRAKPAAVSAGDAMDTDDGVQATSTVASAAVGAEAAGDAVTAARKGQWTRKGKRLPVPDDLPPYELLPIPAAFSARHLPFFVWRSWHSDWQRARTASPTLPLASFLTSPDAPPLSNALLPVTLRCPSGGLPENDAFICLPHADEWRRFRTSTPAPARDPTDPALTHNERHAKPTPWDVLMERNNKLAHPHPLRDTLGYLTHGWFSYQQGMGVGIGFVAAHAFAQLMQQQASDSDTQTAPRDSESVWVWCRNQSGLAYRAAQIQLLPAQ